MVVAEGVESEDQLAQLRELGCDYAQGFWFARPVAARGDRRGRLPRARAAGPRRPVRDPRVHAPDRHSGEDRVSNAVGLLNFTRGRGLPVGGRDHADRDAAQLEPHGLLALRRGLGGDAVHLRAALLRARRAHALRRPAGRGAGPHRGRRSRCPPGSSGSCCAWRRSRAGAAIASSAARPAGWPRCRWRAASTRGAMIVLISSLAGGDLTRLPEVISSLILVGHLPGHRLLPRPHAAGQPPPARRLVAVGPRADRRRSSAARRCTRSSPPTRSPACTRSSGTPAWSTGWPRRRRSTSCGWCRRCSAAPTATGTRPGGWCPPPGSRPPSPRPCA